MSAKILNSIFVAGLFVAQATAQETLKRFDIWGDKDCGLSNSGSAEQLSYSLSIYTDKGFMKKAKDGQYISHCANTMINLGQWPLDSTGSYITYMDPSLIDKGCQLVLFHLPPDDEDIQDGPCFTYYRTVHQGESACTAVTIPKRFGYLYCCGNDCNNQYESKRHADGEPAATAPRQVKGQIVQRRDVTQIKRAPIMGRDVTADKPHELIDCEFKKTEGDVTTTYGAQKKVGGTETCNSEVDSQFPCSFSRGYGVSATITNGKSETWSGGGGVSFPFGITGNFGYSKGTTQDWSAGNTEDATYTLQVAPGTSAYLTFQPKMKCAHGEFTGNGCDSALKIGPSKWCIPSLKGGQTGKIEPDGIWQPVRIS